MSASAVTGTIRTLIVEDDFRIADIHKGFLERLPSFSVAGVAHTAREALQLVERERPDLVLLDIYLPDRSGLELLRDLHATGRAPVDVIAITAANDVETLRSALQGGVVHYLVKPFQFNAFQEKLESYAAARSRLGQVREVDQ
ncbi:MAG TPA: response regulator, partial [Methylomirabilota bacterium]|nr:response regulator [Methylomirabilota bacterium]